MSAAQPSAIGTVLLLGHDRHADRVGIGDRQDAHLHPPPVVIEKHDIVGARWPTDEDLNDDSIIKIARDFASGGPPISLARIAQEKADDAKAEIAALEANLADLG